jgi:tight adherence protein C
MAALLFLAIALGTFSAATLVAVQYSTRSSRLAARRLRDATQLGSQLRARGVRRSAAGKRLFSFVHWVRVRVGMAEDDALKARIERAGYRASGAVDLYLAARVLVPLLALIVGSLSPFNRLLFMLVLPAIGYLLPDMVLQRLVNQRREKIRRSVPDAVDLLVICVDAGLGIDQALLRVSQELTVSHPEITEEFIQINREQRAGKPRIEAWREMADRVGLQEMGAFASMLAQTEKFGTPISRALRVFSDGIRQRRRQTAEELAAKTTVKIIFPLVLFIFPSIFIVLLGPAILSIMRGMGGLGQ